MHVSRNMSGVNTNLIHIHINEPTKGPNNKKSSNNTCQPPTYHGGLTDSHLIGLYIGVTTSILILWSKSRIPKLLLTNNVELLCSFRYLPSWQQKLVPASRLRLCLIPRGYGRIGRSIPRVATVPFGAADHLSMVASPHLSWWRSSGCGQWQVNCGFIAYCATLLHGNGRLKRRWSNHRMRIGQNWEIFGLPQTR